ncbi:MAG: helix-turn-helix domain-containing protein [Patescibacteria group bacterium]
MQTPDLSPIGVGDKATSIYLTALSLGTASVQQIATKAGIKRPTAYLHIEELLRENLLERIRIGKKDFYRACDPQQLKKRAETALTHINTILPELQQLHATGGARPTVRIFEGEVGLKEIYAQLQHANSIRFISDLAATESLFPKSVNDIAAGIAEQQIRTRELIANTPETKRASKRFAAIAGKTYTSRVFAHGVIKNDSAIFGNTVAFFRINEHNLFVIVIEDATIAETMKTLFDHAWEQATTF